MSAMASDRRRPHYLVATAMLLAFPATPALLAGCGGDPPPQAQPEQPRPAPPRPRGPAGGQGGGLQNYPKVPPEYRRDLTDGDFRSDLTGDHNRDPFRSYVIRQSRGRLDRDRDMVIDSSDVCNAGNTKAYQNSLRDLRLIGIILRGTRAWAQFRDSAGNGHIVHRGDCLGKEKAVVEQIGAGYVRLEVTPEAPPGGAAPEPQKHEVPLYPEELDLQDDAIEQR